MLTSKISRYELFMLVSDKVLSNDIVIFANPLYVSSVFKNSATLIYGMEEKFIETNLNFLNLEFDFFSLLQRNYKNIDDKRLQNRIDSFISKYKHNYENKKSHNFPFLFSSLIKILQNFQNETINKYLLKINIQQRNTNLPQIFLSYAYLDKGLTLGLFYYFLDRESFLYVNWMWTDTIVGGDNVKSCIDLELKKSSQLLFLRSAHSELVGDNGFFVRQWCAWELGNFYYQKKDCKFLLNLYETAVRPNEFLESLKIMSGIKDGFII